MKVASRRSPAGFTLVELLIAIFLLAIGLTFVFSLFPVGLYSTRENVAETLGALLAKSALARIRAERVIDRFDTAHWAILSRDADDTVCCLRSGQDGFGPDDVRDTENSLYCWIATYARPVLSEPVSDTGPFDTLRVHIAIVQTGRSVSVDDLFYDRNPTPPFIGRIRLRAGSDTADILQLPSDRSGLVTGYYFCDLRSGLWYRIRDLEDTDGDGQYDRIALDRRAEYSSDGSAFQNALFVPKVVAVFDGMVSGAGRG